MAFETLHEDTHEALSREPFLLGNGVTVLLEDKGDIIAGLAAAIAKMGICAVVAMPSARALSRNALNVAVTADLTVNIFESPLMNRRRANSCTAGAAARRVAAALNLQRLKGGETPAFKEISSGVLDEKGTLLFSVQFEVLTEMRKED